MKTCSKCKETKPLSGFSKKARAKDGRQTYCRECQKQYRKDNANSIREHLKQWRKDNPEYSKQWYKNNPEYSKQWYRQRRKNNPEYGREIKRKRRAQKMQAQIGYVPRTIRTYLEAFYGKVCAVPDCSETENLHIDHVIPLAGGGSHSVWNFQLLCGHHNCSKKAKYADYRGTRQLVGIVPPKRTPVERIIGKTITLGGNNGTI